MAIGDELPRMLTPDSDPSVFDAPTADESPLVLKFRNGSPTAGASGSLMTISVPSDYVDDDGNTVSWELRNEVVWRRNGLNGDGDRVDLDEVTGAHISNAGSIGISLFNVLDQTAEPTTTRPHLTGEFADRFTFIGWNTKIIRTVTPPAEDE